MSSSSRNPVRTKPAKPYKDFPLFAHARGYWCKKILGKQHNFGRWEDWQAALDLYLSQKDDLQLGRTPYERSNGVTVLDLVNSYLTHQESRLEDGEIVQGSFRELKTICSCLLAGIGKRRVVEQLRPQDFARLKDHIRSNRSIDSTRKYMSMCRSIFGFAVKQELIEHPVRYGMEFESPSTKAQKRVEGSKERPLYTAEEIKAILEVSNHTLRTMILLGLNGGYGNADIGRLTVTQVETIIETGWLTYQRGKNGKYRRTPFWEETVQALKGYSRPKADHDCYFVTIAGNSWYAHDREPISRAFSIATKKAGVRNLGFYNLRSVCRTICDRSLDQVACKILLGHALDGMDERYLRQIDDSRLESAVGHVHDWLFGGGE